MCVCVCVVCSPERHNFNNLDSGPIYMYVCVCVFIKGTSWDKVIRMALLCACDCMHAM